MKSSFYRIDLEDVRISLKDLAAILQILSFVVLLPLAATILFNAETTFQGILIDASAFIIPSVVLHGLYRILRGLAVRGQTKTKHLMITVALAWMTIALVGSLPFIVRGALNPLDSFFESMSGWTTTGFTMIEDLESTDRDILLYRGLMQGMGGLGVISLGMMVLLQGGNIGIGYSDVGVERIKPSLGHTIVEAWKIYGLYILFGIVMLYIAGMNLFDAVNHSMAAMATGGFSTHVDIGYYNSLPIEIVLMVLMTLGMTSFILHFRIFSGEHSAFKSEEIRYFVAIIAVSILAISLSLIGKDIPGVNTHSVPDVMRKTSFYVISGMSTTGFNTVDYGRLPDFAKTWMTVLMYVGGMSSSTAGGIRVIRFVVLLKIIHYCMKKLVLPKKTLMLVKVDNRPLGDSLVMVAGYSFIYLAVCTSLALILMLHGYASIDSISTMMSAMGNDGLGVISGSGWYDMPYIGKLTIIFGMWIGRIEVYPGLLILRNILERLRLT